MIRRYRLPLAFVAATSVSLISAQALAEEAKAPAQGSASTAPASEDDSSGPKAKNALFLELLGNGILYSLNYDRRLNDRFSLRAGMMYFSIGASSSDGSSSSKATVLLVPVLFNVLFGGKNHKFELGAGPLVAYASAEASGIGGSAGGKGVGFAGTSSIGYRYSPADGGFFFRAGLAPLISSKGFLPWPELSFGAAF